MSEVNVQCSDASRAFARWSVSRQSMVRRQKIEAMLRDRKNTRDVLRAVDAQIGKEFVLMMSQCEGDPQAQYTACSHIYDEYKTLRDEVLRSLRITSEEISSLSC